MENSACICSLGEALGWFAWHETVGRVTVGLFRRLFRFLYRKLFDPVGAFLPQVCPPRFGKKMQEICGFCAKTASKLEKKLETSPHS